MAARVCYPVRPFSFQPESGEAGLAVSSKKRDAPAVRLGVPCVLFRCGGRLDPSQQILAVDGLQCCHFGERLNAIGHPRIGIEASPDSRVHQALSQLCHLGPFQRSFDRCQGPPKA